MKVQAALLGVVAFTITDPEGAVPLFAVVRLSTGRRERTAGRSDGVVCNSHDTVV